MQIDVPDTLHVCPPFAPLLDDHHEAFHELHVLIIHLHQVTLETVVIVNHARESDTNRFLDVCFGGFHGFLELWTLRDGFHNDVADWLGIGVVQDELFALFQYVMAEGVAILVAVGPEEEVVDVEFVPLEGQPFAVPHADGRQVTPLTVKHVIAPAEVTHLVPEPGADSAVHVEPYNGERYNEYPVHYQQFKVGLNRVK